MITFNGSCITSSKINCRFTEVFRGTYGYQLSWISTIDLTFTPNKIILSEDTGSDTYRELTILLDPNKDGFCELFAADQHKALENMEINSVRIIESYRKGWDSGKKALEKQPVTKEAYD